MPIPSYGFDPTETAIPWKILTAAGFEVVFTTPLGRKANCDQLMLTGKKLGIWKAVLKARQDAVEAYYEMENSNCLP